MFAESDMVHKQQMVAIGDIVKVYVALVRNYLSNVGKRKYVRYSISGYRSSKSKYELLLKKH